MTNKINIVDGNIHINVFLTEKRIYVFSNNYPININSYLDLLKTNNVYSFFKTGSSEILFKGNSKEGLLRKFHFGKITIILSLATLLLINSMTSSSQVLYMPSGSFIVSNYTVDDLHDMIYSSNNLTKEDKDFLFNENLFGDILRVINNNNYIKYMYSIYFNNISIKDYEIPPEDLHNAPGYYTTDEPNVLFVQNYEKYRDYKKDTLAHEFIHLCQDTSGYNLIIEGCAEIISNEYYNTPLSCYSSQVKYVKELMEIIGSEAIWVYNFTGDFSLIEQRVKPYLTENEYKEFLNDLSFDYNDYNLNKPKFESLEIIISKLYKEVYKRDMSEDKIMMLLNKEDKTLNRYYFNKKLINKDNSFYLNYNEGEYKNISLDEAISNNYLIISSILKTPINSEQAIRMAQSGNYSIERVIDYKSANIIMNRTTYSNSKLIFSGFVNGVKYDDCDIDDLVLEGIIKIDYYLVDLKKLSASEYLNHEYSDESTIIITKLPDTEFDEKTGLVYGFVPKKIYLPLTSEIYEEEKEETKGF